MYLRRSSLMLSMNEVIFKSGCRDGGVWDDERGEVELEFLLRRVRGRRRRVGAVVMDVEVREGVGVGSLSGGPRSFS